MRLLDGLGDRAKDYYPFHVVRADLLRRTGQLEKAVESYKRAIALCDNPAERSHLQRQLDLLAFKTTAYGSGRVRRFYRDE